ncbi:hypothetical protein LB467_15130 [Salegentibacter sp. JZCK2]|uniref:hypothetical protein n=1 Tax=Salegentibacter tibetensis TaxID=2873600 RepID=UPI001CC9431A|nr:hypothetical protein [Salegentibacter tibetensis]MBZ9731026.1 hypothetical protein [Salegentibacter tibetensis]
MNNSQIINTILIVFGGGFLIYAIAADNAHAYFKIVGLIVIMLGLYRATNLWVATKDDHKEDENKE